MSVEPDVAAPAFSLLGLDERILALEYVGLTDERGIPGSPSR